MVLTARTFASGSIAVGKSIVIVLKDRTAGRVKANVVPDTKQGTLHDFIHPNSRKSTDEDSSCRGLDNNRTIGHRIGKWSGNGPCKSIGIRSGNC